MNIQSLVGATSMYATLTKSNVQRQELPASTAKATDAVTISDEAKALAARNVPAPTDTAKKVDFTSMTRQDLKDWINNQISSGEMSLDDSTGFVGMTLNGMSVDDVTMGASKNNETFDYIHLMRAGIEGAKSRNESEATIKRFEGTLLTMLQNQV